MHVAIFGRVASNQVLERCQVYMSCSLTRKRLVIMRAACQENWKARRRTSIFVDSFLPSRFSAGREGSATEALSRCAEISQPKPDCNTLHSASRASGLGSAQVVANSLHEGNLQLPPSNLREPWDCHPANIEPPIFPSNALSSPPLSPWPSIVQATALMRSNLLMPDTAEDISN